MLLVLQEEERVLRALPVQQWQEALNAPARQKEALGAKEGLVGFAPHADAQSSFPHADARRGMAATVQQESVLKVRSRMTLTATVLKTM